eukprot:SAG31_NODE_11502_length_1023_cov_1.431818_2_plen_88_part_01
MYVQPGLSASGLTSEYGSPGAAAASTSGARSHCCSSTACATVTAPGGGGGGGGGSLECLESNSIATPNIGGYWRGLGIAAPGGQRCAR